MTRRLGVPGAAIRRDLNLDSSYIRIDVALRRGAVAGIVVVAALAWFAMPGLMLRGGATLYGVDETVECIRRNAVDQGWMVSRVRRLDESIRRHGGDDLQPVCLINVCQADHAHRILDESDQRIISVMMPCTISVYEKGGETCIGTMNGGLMGRMFGGTVAEVMGRQVAAQQKRLIQFGGP